MLEVVTFLWEPKEGYRSQFSPEHVNVLRSMVQRHYPKPHRFNVVTDMSASLFNPSIRVIPLWEDHANLVSPHGDHQPACYRRLKLFSPEAAQIIGPRLVSMDIDCVITRDVSDLWNRKEEVVLWSDTNPSNPYNGSMLLHSPGTRAHVWSNFHPVEGPRAAKQAGFFGSDQAWLCHALGPNEARWNSAHGVYSWRVHIKRRFRGTLPTNAKIVFFHGKEDPWSPHIQRDVPWVCMNWR